MQLISRYENFSVMPALVAGIQGGNRSGLRLWIAGTSPAMTIQKSPAGLAAAASKEQGA